MHVCVLRYMCEGTGQLEEICSVFRSCRFWDPAHIATYQQALLYIEFLSLPKCCSWPSSPIGCYFLHLAQWPALTGQVPQITSQLQVTTEGHPSSCITNWLLSYTLVLWTFWIVYMCACSDRGAFKQIPSKSTLLWRTCYQTSKMTLGRHVLMQGFFFFYYDKCQYMWEEAYTYKKKKTLTTLQALLAKTKQRSM